MAATARWMTRLPVGTIGSRLGQAAGRRQSRYLTTTTQQQQQQQQQPWRIVSGIQPTGVPHLGNYLGALQNWTALQNNHDVLYMVVDLHALTVPQPPAMLHQRIREMTASLLACGVDPARSVLFQQSTVPEHSELAWILTCHTPVGWLRRMTQWKAKAAKQDAGVDPDSVAAFASPKILTGLLVYPALMASDVLLYNTTHVPVGEDQLQHLELARELARTINHQYRAPLFVEPQPILGTGRRIMSLRDGRSKMSKSDPSDQSRINLDDSPEAIQLKLRRAKTDAGAQITYEPDTRPEVANLLEIYSALSGDGTDAAALAARLGPGTTMAQFKTDLADLVIQRLAPIQQELARLRQDPGYVDTVLSTGCDRARALATAKLREVKRALGLDRDAPPTSRR